MQNIRNFSIIAHIDHGKSTLADRLLEETATIERRKMKNQVLDMMDLERERGITIKMQPIKMRYLQAGQEYILNLIDTPGHVDFAYEVSRALEAVEGVILLVDAAQGVQAQTLTVLALAQDLGRTVIPVLNKIDLPQARVEETRAELVELLNCNGDDILAVSGKTGAGVSELLQAIVERVPPPEEKFPETAGLRALVFDFEYSNHQGLIVYIRVADGSIKKGDNLVFGATGEKFIASSVGLFRPEKVSVEQLRAGEIGYVVTGIKNPGQAKVGDTIIKLNRPLPLFPGYTEPRPVVWASLYPENQKDFNLLKQALGRLRLSDASLYFEEESSIILGRGFRAGFLGLLHLEIVTERLRREHQVRLITATPTIGYQIQDERTGEERFVYSPSLFPEDLKHLKVLEPWVSAQVITPPDYLGSVIKLFNDHEVILLATDNFGRNRTVMRIELPLRELMRNFFDELKSVSSGFASFSYVVGELRPADVVRLDILVNDEMVPAFTRMVARKKVEIEAQAVAEKLKDLLPRQLIIVKIQARALGRILASRTLSALRKDVTDYLYGGDITRKMKLREKQKKGKKKMQSRGRVNIPPEVFLKMISSTGE